MSDSTVCHLLENVLAFNLIYDITTEPHDFKPFP